MTLSLSRIDLIRTRNFIGGQWVKSSDATFGVRDPADDSIIVEIPDSDGADAKAAVDAASTALPAWRAAPARVRSQVLKRWHALMLLHQEDLARLISREQGKPLCEARGEILYAASYVEWFAEEAIRTYGDVIPETIPGRKMFVVKEGVGVVAAITPWNFPAAMIARKIAPALAAGCTVIAKPAEDTPLTSLALAALAQEAGVPAGVLNVVTASRSKAAEVVDIWLGDPRVRKITFTGSTAVGKHLARESAATLKRLSLELGGNAPFIVFDDADVDAAVEGLMAAKFRNGGQTCVSPNRVFVQAAVHDIFATKLAVRVAALRVGPASEEASQIGPMINQQAVRKIESGGPADRTGPVDQSRTLRRHDHVVGVKVAVAKLVARRQALDQGEDAGGDVRRNLAAAVPQVGVHPVAQREHVRWQRRLVNGKAEVREDGARLPARHGAAPHELQQGWSVMALQHDAEAVCQGHHAQQLRRRAAGGEDGVGHLRLVPAEPPRMA